MKKLFTLVCALAGFAFTANAAGVDDIKVCQHSLVLDCSTYANAGRAKGTLFGSGFFLDVTGGSTGSKGAVAPADKLGDKYAKYAVAPSKTLRLKNAQDVIAMRITAGSKLIILGESHASRSPKVNDKADMTGTAINYYLPNTKDTEGVFEWTAQDDGLIYIGSNGGDYYFSWIIVEANEAPGTPTVTVSDMQYDETKGRYYIDVTCTPNDFFEEGSAEAIPTIVTYTTNGDEPTAASEPYTGEPVACYENQIVKFQAFQDFGMGFDDDFICPGANNQGIVEFTFGAPTITADGANVTISTEYKNASNYYQLNGAEAVKGDAVTLNLSAEVKAYTVIDNGEGITFTSAPATSTVYIMDAIKEKQTITVSGTAVVDEEETAKAKESDVNAANVYKIDGGQIAYDTKYIFIQSPVFKALATDDEKVKDYQVPVGQEAYIQMSDTKISFKVAEGDSVDVKVICSMNACKNLAADDAADGAQVNDRKCIVTVNGTNYFHKNAEGAEQSDQKLYPGEANIIEFGLKGAAGGTVFTFSKYSGTGAIYISSIEITPVDATATGIKTIETAAKQSGAIFNLAGQRVAAGFRGIVVKNGKKMIQK